MTDVSVSLCGKVLKNPIIPASGVFGFGREYAKYYDLSRLGAVAAKGITPLPKAGAPPHRIAETSAGILNCVGLQNPGADAFIETELPFLKSQGAVVIANISADSVQGYAEIAAKLSRTDVDFIEVNVSCPNVKKGGLAFGTDPENVGEVTKEVKNAAGNVPVIVKLTPNVTDIVSIARAAADCGADGLSLINTLRGMRIDVKTKSSILSNVTGGLSGPAIFPVAVRCVYEVRRALPRIPIIGMGGVMSGEDAAELLLAGADAVGVGTAVLQNPYAPLEILEQLINYMKQNGFGTIRELKGAFKG